MEILNANVDPLTCSDAPGLSQVSLSSSVSILRIYLQNKILTPTLDGESHSNEDSKILVRAVLKGSRRL